MISNYMYALIIGRLPNLGPRKPRRSRGDGLEDFSGAARRRRKEKRSKISVMWLMLRF